MRLIQLTARLMKKMESGKFDLDDFASQLRQLRKMGGLSGVMGMLPGVKKAQAQLRICIRY